MSISRGDIAIGGLIVALGAGFVLARAHSDDPSPAEAAAEAPAEAPAATETAPEVVVALDRTDEQAANDEVVPDGEAEDQASASEADPDEAAPEPAEPAQPAAPDPSIFEEQDFPARFGVGEASPRKLDAEQVSEFARRYAACPGTVMVMGHTDASGDHGENRRISEDRARFVQAMLSQQGAERIRIQGRGSDAPIASNTSHEGRARNRRVSVVCKR
ncbi:OmpA family protein [Haliangium sp.]|uniref:OmpA family protein n=1 Tax=Haliangium sp. TaxID=2663208 RepID=UPI003D0AD19C